MRTTSARPSDACHLVGRATKRRARTRATKAARARWRRAAAASDGTPFGDPARPAAVEDADGVVPVVAERPGEAAGEDVVVVVVGDDQRVVADAELGHLRGERRRARPPASAPGSAGSTMSRVQSTKTAPGTCAGVVVGALGQVAGLAARGQHLAAHVDDARSPRLAVAREPVERRPRATRSETTYLAAGRAARGSRRVLLDHRAEARDRGLDVLLRAAAQLVVRALDHAALGAPRLLVGDAEERVGDARRRSALK